MAGRFTVKKRKEPTRGKKPIRVDSLKRYRSEKQDERRLTKNGHAS